MKLNLITPSTTIYSDEVSSIIVPGSEGDLGLLKNHTPIICSLRSGLVIIYKEKKCFKKIFVNDGMLEFSENDAIILAEYATDIDTVEVSEIESNIMRLEEAGNLELLKIEKIKLYNKNNQFYN
tara:strand:+ start:757 stop:1128 length:372 start_codon:yes stop_codon:yes gene_type:complete